MGSMMERVKGFFNNYEDEDYDSRYFDEEFLEEEIVPVKTRKTFTDTTVVSPIIKKPETAQPNIVDFKSFGSQRLLIVNPETMEEAQQVAKEFTSGRIVICNFENVDYRIAQRMIDFLTGSAYALNGQVKSVSSRIYTITPNHITLMDGLEVEEEANMDYVRKMVSSL